RRTSLFAPLLSKNRGTDATQCPQHARATPSLIIASNAPARNPHRRWPQKPIFQAIAAAGLSDDPTFGNFVTWFMADRLVQVGIKLFSNRINWLQSIVR